MLTEATASRKEAYFIERLRTNSAADANGGTGPNVQHLINFGEAVEAATDDVELAQVIKQYTAAKDWATYFAVDRAIEHWDGPSNFRAEGRTAWTHNFFLFEVRRTRRGGATTDTPRPPLALLDPLLSLSVLLPYRSPGVGAAGRGRDARDP